MIIIHRWRPHTHIRVHALAHTHHIRAFVVSYFFLAHSSLSIATAAFVGLSLSWRGNERERKRGEMKGKRDKKKLLKTGRKKRKKNVSDVYERRTAEHQSHANEIHLVLLIWCVYCATVTIHFKNKSNAAKTNIYKTSKIANTFKSKKFPIDWYAKNGKIVVRNEDVHQ